MKLQDIIDALDTQSSELKYFYDKKSKELFFVIEDYGDEYSLELIEKIEENPNNYIQLPSPFEINEHRMMVDFAYMQDDEIQDTLLDVLYKKKAFRNFKDKVFYLGISDEWFEYKNERLKAIAKEWCEENGIEVEE